MKKRVIKRSEAVLSAAQILILVIATFAFAYLVNPENGSNVKQKTELGKSSLIENTLNKIVAKLTAPMLVLVSAEIMTTNTCCERLKNGAWCQNAAPEECDEKYAKSPTSCDATSFCKQGCCYDSSEGVCMENSPELVCQQSGGVWADDNECNIPQCQLGCCVLSTQAAFVTLTRCKKLTSFYGLETDFRTNVKSELDCIAQVQLEDKGACVYDVDFGKTCEFTTRQNCEAGAINKTGKITSEYKFYKDWLCSAEELGTGCGPSKKTTCVPGKDEVYFLDTCGNVANIYDSKKADDALYWKKIVGKQDSCGAGNTNGNTNSKECGNCDYFSGSFCGQAERGSKASLGDYICQDLNCYNTYNGKDYRNGESWCVNDDKINTVGSRYFKHVCMNGQEILEPCEDFRANTCIQDSIATSKGNFQQAACRPNLWQDCTTQTEQIDCENTDKRDCNWLDIPGFGIKAIPFNTEEVKVPEASQEPSEAEKVSGICVPKNAPGLKHYEASDAGGVCGQASIQCVVTFEKGLIGKEGKCTENCECLDEQWVADRNEICMSLGDCGGKTNYLGRAGYKSGYNVSTTKLGELFLPLLKFSAFVLFGDVGVVRGADKGKPCGEKISCDPGLVCKNNVCSEQTLDSGVGLGSLIVPGKINTDTRVQAVTSYKIGQQVTYNNKLATIKEVDADGTYKIEYINDPTKIGATTTNIVNFNEINGLSKIETGSFDANKLQKAGYNDLYYSGDKTVYGLKDGQLKEISNPSSVGVDPTKLGSTGTTPAQGLQNYLNTGLGKSLMSGLMFGAGAAMLASLALPKGKNSALAGFVAGMAGKMAADMAASMGVKGLRSTLIGAGVGLLIFILLYKEESQQVVTFTCNSWEAPTGGSDCQKCNQDSFKPCSDYKCRSLGQACELLNAGTDKEMCTYVSRGDVVSPGISPWEFVLTDGYKYTDVRIRPPGDGSEPGRMSIERTGTDKCVKAFMPLTFGITTLGPDNKAEPAQCKIDYDNTKKFDDMKYYFGESNLYDYNHTQTMRLPGPSNINAEYPTIKNDGKYSLFVRCKDRNGNENVDPFVINFCVEKGPDATAPIIVDTSIVNGKPVQYGLNETPLDIYVNEPANCRWSRLDKSYESMDYPMTCADSLAKGTVKNNEILYKCSATLDGLQNRKENLYYFRCKDVAGNDNKESYEFKLIGTEPLNILKTEPDNETIKGYQLAVPVNLEVETANGYHQGDAICYYSLTGKEDNYIAFKETGTNLHIQRQDLPAGSYKYSLKCVDLGGNAAYQNISFKVEVDQQAPEIVRAYNYPGSTSLCGNSGCLAIVTDEKSTCSYSSKDCNFDIKDGKEMPFADSKEHYAEWKTSITYYIRCKDSADNEPLPNRCSIIMKGYELS